MATKKKKLQPVADLVRKIDFPHTRLGLKRKWRKAGPGGKREPHFAFDRLCFYAERLREMGMADGDIAGLLSDLYWDAVTEYTLAMEEVAQNN